ncbi:APC family permease [Yinghuangia aomiensis]
MTMHGTPTPPGADAAVPTSSAPSGEGHLTRGAIGTGDLVFFVVAAAAPLTVIAGGAPLAIGMGGKATPFGYFVSGLLLMCFAAGFTAMSRYVRNAGAFYAYIGQGLGRPAGVGAAYVAILAYNMVEVGLLAGFGFFAETGIDSVFGFHMVWWAWSLIGLVAIGALGYLKVTLSAKVLGVALVLECLILLVLDGGIFADGGGPQGLDFTVFDPGHLGDSGVGGMFVLAIGAFVGFEATAIYAEEAKDPARSVPRATYIAVGFLGIFYAFSVWMILNAYGSDNAQAVAQGEGGPDMVYTAAGHFVGQWASDAMHVLIITSAFAATLAFHNGAARYFYAMGREGLMPRKLATIDRRMESPVVAVVAQSALALIGVLVTIAVDADPYMITFLWTNATGILGVMAMQLLAALAVVGYFRKDRRGFPVWRVVVAPVVAAVGLGYMIYKVVDGFDMLTASGDSTNAALIVPIPVVFAIGVVVALGIRARQPERYARLTTVDVERD